MSISAEKFDSHVCISDEIPKPMTINFLIHDNYLYKKIYMEVSHIAEANNRPHDIDKAHYRALVMSSRKSHNGYVRGTITLYFHSTVNCKDATYATAVYNNDGMKLLKERYPITRINGLLASLCRELMM